MLFALMLASQFGICVYAVDYVLRQQRANAAAGDDPRMYTPVSFAPWRR